MPQTAVISVVIPTCDRLTRLQRCIARVRANTGKPLDIIVVDGASTDGTADWLQSQPNIRVITERQREGAVRAFNKGFRAATGEYVCWLNDDSYPLPGALDAAVAMIERPDLADVGMVAFYHNWDRMRNVLHSVTRDGEIYSVYNVRGVPYANFGLLRRSLLERLDYADERYYFFAFDPDLSLAVQRRMGLNVVGCPDALIHHDEHHDDRKLGDLAVGEKDNRKLFEKWNLPGKDEYADPAPAYVEMIVSRSIWQREPVLIQ